MNNARKIIAVCEKKNGKEGEVYYKTSLNPTVLKTLKKEEVDLYVVSGDQLPDSFHIAFGNETVSREGLIVFAGVDQNKKPGRRTTQKEEGAALPNKTLSA